ncbi:MAG: WYL domain-containing protein [Actinomycetes bacterium]
MAHTDGTQRLMDLILVLLNESRPISREALRRKVPLYSQDNDVNFQRMFERDKSDLREMNIPLETRAISSGFDDEKGYFLDRRQWLLPELNLSAHERMLITLAASVWQDQELQAQARTALHNVGGSIYDQPHVNSYLAGQQTNLLDLIDAIANSKQVSFEYDSFNSKTLEQRVVDPWRLFMTAGAWYLVCFDLNREKELVFRLSRIVGSVSTTGEPRENPAPEDLDVKAIVAGWQDSAVEPQTATLRVAVGRCSNLRSRATSVVTGEESDEITISFGFERDMAREIASVCQFVQVVEPESLRNLVSSLVSLAGQVNS